MSTLNPRLQLALLNRKKSRNALQKGFTLVELMIVIVIVGILSAIALPIFLNQTLKAKGTEARSDNATITKNAAAEYSDGGAKLISELVENGTASDVTVNANYTFGAVDDSCVGLSARSNAQTTKFDYYCEMVLATDAKRTAWDCSADACPDNDYILVVTAIGDASDSGLTGRVVTHLLNLDNGHTQLVKAGTCKAFGGTETADGGTASVAQTITGTIDCEV